MQLHSTPLSWEVVDSYSVDPVRVFLEDEGAVITRIASHEIVGEYTFDMTHPSLASSPKTPKKSIAESRTGHKEASHQGNHLSHEAKPNQPVEPNRPNQRRRASLPERRERSAKIDCFGYLTRRQLRSGRSFEWRFPLRRSSLPGPLSPQGAPPNLKEASSTLPTDPATTGRQQQQRSAQKWTTFSFLRLHRRPSDSGSSSSSSSLSSLSASDGNVGGVVDAIGNTIDADKPVQSKQESSAPSSPPKRSILRESRDLRVSVKPQGYKKSDVKKAIIFARGELMKQVEKSGKNALLVEGWTVTVLKQEERYRIQVVYTGKPALVDFSNATNLKRQPPFLQVIQPELL